MPLHTVAKPIIGNHYFGDYQLELGYATNLRQSISPYLLRHNPDPALPVTQVFFILFTFLPLRMSVFVYLTVSIVLFLVPLWLLLAPLKPEYRVLFLTPTAVLTTPFISFLDRGNDIGIAVGLLAWAIWAWRSERWILCGAFLVAAIALKEYPVAVLVVPLGLRRYKFTAAVAASVVVTNFLALVVFPGGYLRNLRAALPVALSQQNWYTSSEKVFSWSAFEVFPKTVGLIISTSAANKLEATSTVFLWLPSILYLCGVYFVIRRGRVPQWCWGPLSLASVQLLLPLSFVYTTAWAPVAAVWFAWGYLLDIRDETLSRECEKAWWVTLRIMVLLALTATLAPSVFTVSGFSGYHTEVAQYLSPVFILVTLFTAIIRSLRPMTLEPQSVSVG